MEDVRRTIKVRLEGASQEVLDAQINDVHSIGSLLYHIALIEADWLYEEVLVSPWPVHIRALFPHENLNEKGDLVHVKGIDVTEHFKRLDAVRNELISNISVMDIGEWRRTRELERYNVTPEWVLYHLIEHEAHHRGQIFQVLSMLEGAQRRG